LFDTNAPGVARRLERFRSTAVRLPSNAAGIPIPANLWWRGYWFVNYDVAGGPAELRPNLAADGRTLTPDSYTEYIDMVGLTATQFSLGMVMSPTGRSAGQSPPTTTTPTAFWSDPTSEEPVLPAEEEQRVANLPMADDSQISSPLRQGSVLDGVTTSTQLVATNRSVVLPCPETVELVASRAASTAGHSSSVPTVMPAPLPEPAAPIHDRTPFDSASVVQMLLTQFAAQQRQLNEVLRLLAASSPVSASASQQTFAEPFAPYERQPSAVAAS
jgi:hypothetical protein